MLKLKGHKSKVGSGHLHDVCVSLQLDQPTLTKVRHAHGFPGEIPNLSDSALTPQTSCV